jgi:thioredoxin-related protein
MRKKYPQKDFLWPMKKLICLFMVSFFCLVLHAQTELPPYKKTPYFPQVKLLLADSVTWYQRDDLPKKTAVMMMYFNPTCDHCQKLTEEIVKNIDRFKNIHIVMAASQHFDSMRVFSKRYHLADHKNIVIGYDPDFSLMHYYRVASMPFLAFYNQWKELISAFNGGLPVDKILKEFGE